MRNAYAPYSEFKVGAALRSPSGAIHVGANVENAAYPQGQCAEASAIGAMVAAGDRAISAVAVVAEKLDVCPPCGGCRQRLKEFAAPDTPVYLGRPGGPVQTTTMAELLPLAFDEESLPKAAGMAAIDLQAPTGRRQGVTHSDAAAAVLRKHVQPRVGIVLGSGLGAVADAVEDAVTVGYDELPGFPRPTVHGHAGRAVLGHLRGVAVCVLMGRAHMYEGGDPAPRVTPVRALAAAGAEVLVLTNAAGSLRPEVGPGRLMAIADHINLTGHNPLIGPNDDAIGPRFPSLSGAYDPALLADLHASAAELDIDLAEGVYLAVSGPSFETPAEIRAFRTMGADAVGMSTVHETILARHAGLRVAAVSAISNLAEGMSDVPLSHEQTLTDAARAAGDLAPLLEAFVGRLA